MAGASLTARSQRWRIALAVPALFGIFVVGELLLDRFAWRIDLTPQARYSLSERARAVLDGLPAEVRIVAFLRSQDPRNLMIEDMLRQAAAHSPRLRVEVLDVNRSPALARQYGVDSYGALVVESEGRRRSLSNPNEDGLTAALLQVTRQQRRTIGWLMGHGEGDLESLDRTRGFSTARTLLEHEYYDVRPVSLLGDEVPPEVEVLVVAGPQKDLLADELSALDRYLQRGGHALVMLDPQRAPGLARLLRRYGIEVGGRYGRRPGPPALRRRVPDDAAAAQSRRPSDPRAAGGGAAVLADALGATGAGGGRDRVGGLPPHERGELGDERRRVRAHRHPATSSRGGTSRGRCRSAPRSCSGRWARPGRRPSRDGWSSTATPSSRTTSSSSSSATRTCSSTRSPGWRGTPPAIAHRPFAAELGIEQFFVSNEEAERAFWGTAVIVPGLLALVGLGLVWQRRRA